MAWVKRFEASQTALLAEVLAHADARAMRRRK
jgi:hypothetical protein